MFARGTLAAVYSHARVPHVIAQSAPSFCETPGSGGVALHVQCIASACHVQCHATVAHGMRDRVVGRVQRQHPVASRSVTNMVEQRARPYPCVARSAALRPLPHRRCFDVLLSTQFLGRLAQYG